MDLRHFINLVEKASQFDTRQYFRHLSMLALEVHAMVRRKDQAAVLPAKLKELMATVRLGKEQAKNMSAEQYGPFIAQIDKLVQQAGAKMPQPAAAPAPATPQQGDLRVIDAPKPNLSKTAPVPLGKAYTRERQPGDPEWRIINLAVKPGATGQNEPFGIAQQDQTYYVFKGVNGGQYSSHSTDLEDAKKQFAGALKQGYSEVSPGSYNAMRMGANMAAQPSKNRYDPQAQTGTLPDNARYWR